MTDSHTLIVNERKYSGWHVRLLLNTETQATWVEVDVGDAASQDDSEHWEIHCKTDRVKAQHAFRHPGAYKPFPDGKLEIKE